MGEYEAPQLTDLGSVREFTAAFGEEVASDTLFEAPGSDVVVDPAPPGFQLGSRDGAIIPV